MSNFNNLTPAEREFMANFYLSVKEWEKASRNGTDTYLQDIKAYIAERDGAK